MPARNTTLRLLLRCRGLLKRPKARWSTSAFYEHLGHNDDYDESFPKRLVLAPAIWLAVVWVCLVLMLLAVGYLAPDFDEEWKTEALSKGFADTLKGTSVDYPARRAALAFAGVTAGITVALAGASLFWAAMAASVCAGEYRVRVIRWVAGFLLLTLLASLWLVEEPFASELGRMLLAAGTSDLKTPWAAFVPHLMFLLACVVPSILLAGACFLLQPMGHPQSPKQLDAQLRRLTIRLRELDQMLYVGALALVFGTLQLSAGLSVALASQPKAADLKTRIDFCKAMAPTPQASSPFFGTTIPGAPGPDAAPRAPSNAASANAVGMRATSPSVAASAVSAANGLSTFNSQCLAVAVAFSRLDAAESLKQLVRGVTLGFGLAFSALLAAIYVPALIVLRQMLEPRQRAMLASGGKAEVASIDALARVGATVATLSPLFAGLLANTLAGG